MKTPIDADFIRAVAKATPDDELVKHLFSMLDTEDLKRGMMEYIEKNDNLDDEELLIEAIELCKAAGRLGGYR